MQVLDAALEPVVDKEEKKKAGGDHRETAHRLTVKKLLRKRINYK